MTSLRLLFFVLKTNPFGFENGAFFQIARLRVRLFVVVRVCVDVCVCVLFISFAFVVASRIFNSPLCFVIVLDFVECLLRFVCLN